MAFKQETSREDSARFSVAGIPIAYRRSAIFPSQTNSFFLIRTDMGRTAYSTR